MKLLAVRHGQASFHAEDYDKLSDLGSRQSRALGEWLLRHNYRFDRVVSGNLRRHAETLAAIQACFSAAGRPLPAVEIDPSFDEFDHRRVIAGFIRCTPEHPCVAAADFGRSRDPQLLFTLLRHALRAWALGALDQHAEPWSAFKQRTRSAGQTLAERAMDQHVLLVSSGGVISQLVAMAMEAPDHRAVDLNLSLRNAALSELQWLEGAPMLGSWNGLPHLADQRSMWSYV
ncbi:histidine phosphatase family protein [Pseudomarimonas arenosa]|uniref:Histidine phosphatase family protein n=1 Tax=Pseudomarimonas arenosa TaxID=2774145 RepID=A0AAW3ZHV9_9GAMM|nr:histidine phosphatase family protein [Pseudomarimonas arenosa]MBD8525583.1 histidine phosphatase family protein [Pseudomarimonas arenosa]